MLVKKALLAACAAALTTTPAWALPAQAPSNHGTSHAPSTPANQDGHGGGHGKSHKCKPHKVAYVAGGALVSQTLTQGTDGRYSGDLVVDVKRGNRFAKADKGTQVTYTLADARLTLGVADVNNDGSVGLDDLAAGDAVKVIGKVTRLAKKCDQSTFTAERTIRRVVVNAPPAPEPTTDAPQQS